MIHADFVSLAAHRGLSQKSSGVGSTDFRETKSTSSVLNCAISGPRWSPMACPASCAAAGQSRMALSQAKVEVLDVSRPIAQQLA